MALVSPSEGTPDELVSRATLLFNASSNVENDEITFARNHDLTTGQSLVYHAGNVDAGGTVAPVVGLTDGQIYYVIEVDDTKIKLASSLDNANAGDALPLSPGYVETNLDSLTTARSFAQSEIANNAIVFSHEPKLSEGQAVVYNQGSGSASIGLTDGQVYYVIELDATRIQLASLLTEAQAEMPVPIPLTALSPNPDMLG